ncbi:hypothetical protein MG293_010138 [Ovis ammon polii]|uniref:Vexin n=1 Tax=Ovis ammon polii TaxID=230172 RepID=A0AAD4Y9J4_OVIAM|nr:hypothetical protein MG293_010138 [Ovis ammon polii]
MHQIYSCSDENIEVFTTVIPSKGDSIQRLTVSGQSPPGFVTAPHNSSSSSVLAQGPRPGDSGPSSSPQVVIESDLYAPRPLELLPHRTDRRDGEGRRSGRFQNPRLQGPHPAKTPARPGRCIPALRANDHSPCPPRLFCRSRHLKKMTEEFPTLPQGAEASLPLTGSAPCGMPSILRKMWTRHKKKSEYVGATNSAFEAD